MRTLDLITVYRLAAPLVVRDGALQLESGYVPRLDAQSIARHRIDSFTCTARGAVRVKTA